MAGNYGGEEGTAFLIPAMNQLQDLLMDIDLGRNVFPEIVVIGDQNSGKISLLESLVGKNFLPRGDGFVTRFPIIIRLIYTPEIGNDQALTEWCEFGHRAGEKCTDFGAVSQEILRQTNLIEGHGIREQPLVMTVYSPHVVTLTIVDLPPIIRARNDKPNEIGLKKEILELIRMYITKPSTLIVAVAPANTDILTSETISLSRAYDPTGERTMVVLTRLDKGDNTRCAEFISGHIQHVNFGYIGVICRTDEELARGVTTQQAKLNEMQFIFDNFTRFSSKNGTLFLAHRLSKLLQTSIPAYLSVMVKQVSKCRRETKKLLDSLGESELKDKPKTIMSRVINKFSDRFTSHIGGTRSRSRNFESWGPTFEERLQEIMVDTLSANIDSIDPLNGITDVIIANTILHKSSLGSRKWSLEETYKYLEITQIFALLEPCTLCANSVMNELEKIIQLSCTEEDESILRFPVLKDNIVTIVQELLNEKNEEVISHVKKHLEIQTTVTTSARQAFLHESCLIIEGSIQNNVEIVKQLICKSFDIFGESLKDYFPKTVHRLMLSHISKKYNVVKALDAVLKKGDKIEELIQISPEVLLKIKETKQKIHRLVAAEKIIAELKQKIQL